MEGRSVSLRSILGSPNTNSPTIHSNWDQIGLVGYGGVRDGLVSSWLRGSDDKFEGVSRGIATSKHSMHNEANRMRKLREFCQEAAQASFGLDRAADRTEQGNVFHQCMMNGSSEPDRGRNLTRMLNSKSNFDSLKHAVTTGGFAIAGAERIVYCHADMALAVMSLARRYVAMVDPQPDPNEKKS